MRAKYYPLQKNDYLCRELFESTAPQNTEIRIVTKSLPLTFQNSVNRLFINRLNQTENNLK